MATDDGLIEFRPIGNEGYRVFKNGRYIGSIQPALLGQMKYSNQHGSYGIENSLNDAVTCLVRLDTER